jgi:alkylation response protein AidB-like acyl-CoA dehydrogenase
VKASAQLPVLAHLPTQAWLRRALSALPPQADVSTQLNELMRMGLDKLPLPGQGATLQRWQALALVAGHSLSLAKLYEGHTDALAILAELGEQADDAASCDGASWGVWAAEAANTRVIITPTSDGAVLLNGTKCWCSGAQTLHCGLLTAWYADGRGPQLVRVAMHQPGVSVSCEAWHAVGMAASASVDVTFSQARAMLVGQPRDYTARPGFWQGGAGIAACWYGGARFLGEALHQALCELPPEARGAFRLAALGKVDLALHSTAAVLRDAAQWIDDNPLADARATALRTRLAAESCAKEVLDEAGRALGAAAFCRNARFARTAADLPVFVRQSHADRDFTALAESTLLKGDTPWPL